MSIRTLGHTLITSKALISCKSSPGNLDFGLGRNLVVKRPNITKLNLILGVKYCKTLLGFLSGPLLQLQSPMLIIVNCSTPNSHPERESSVIFENPFGARLLRRLAVLRDDDVTLVVTHSRRHVGHQRRRRLRWDAVERLFRAHQRVCLQSKCVRGFN